MTPGELKFALLVENVLNHIPQPEYRQLVVETLVILTLFDNAPGIPFFKDNIRVDQVLIKASDLFHDDLVSFFTIDYQKYPVCYDLVLPAVT